MRGIAALMAGLAFALCLAPAAQAACGIPIGTCDTSWTGTEQEFLATPAAVQADQGVRSFAGKPFAATVTHSYEDFSGIVQRVFSRNGLTRVSTRQEAGPTVITYVKGDRACTRKVTKRFPNTFAADAVAPWACGPRTDKDLDAASWLATQTPAYVLASHPDRRWYADTTLEPPAQPLPAGQVESTLQVALLDSKVYRYDWVFVPGKMLLDQNSYDGAYWEERATLVTTKDVPRLNGPARLTP